jgi:hypothetical protein
MARLPRHYEIETVGPIPDWWDLLFVRRQIEIRRRIKLILATSGPRRRPFFIAELGGEYDRQEVDHALYLLVGDLVIDRDGDYFRLRTVAAREA